MILQAEKSSCVSLGVTFQGKCGPEMCSIFTDRKGRWELAVRHLHDVLPHSGLA